MNNGLLRALKMMLVFDVALILVLSAISFFVTKDTSFTEGFVQFGSIFVGIIGVFYFFIAWSAIRKNLDFSDFQWIRHGVGSFLYIVMIKVSLLFTLLYYWTSTKEKGLGYWNEYFHRRLSSYLWIVIVLVLFVIAIGAGFMKLVISGV